MEKMELFLMPGCSSCDEINTFVAEKKLPITQRWVDKEPGALDEVEKATGSRKVPCLRSGHYWIYEPNAIRSTLEGCACACPHH
eukprot:m51a1_g13319 hypothetical protein (84) ;mRNA; f:880-1131